MNEKSPAVITASRNTRFGIRGVGIVLLLTLGVLLPKAYGFSQACQLVAQMAGNQEYQQQPLRVASMVSPDRLPQDWGLTELERHGAWFVYKTPEPWMSKETCAPIEKWVGSDKVEFMPVLLNRQTGHNAVVTGAFIIKIYRKRHWEKVMQKYGFKMLSPLPNPRAMIVDVKPTDSYDLLIQALDRDKDVELGLPLLSEPRTRR